MLHPRPVLGALAAVALLAAGCGSTGDAAQHATTSTPAAADAAGAAPTQAAYVQEADAVCRKARVVSRRANVAVHEAFAAGRPAAAADAIDQYMPTFAKHVQTLKDLRQPEGDGKVLAGLIKVMESQVIALAEESRALREHDDAVLKQVGAAQRQGMAFAEELGKAYGFTVCGRAA
jgi:hypothetical protein